MAKAITVTGVKALDRALANLEPKLQKKALRQASRKATKYVQKEVKRLSPKQTGVLQRAYRVRTVAKRGGTRAQRAQIGTAVVTSRAWLKADKFYAPYVELGTRQKTSRRHLRKGLFESERVVFAVFRGELYSATKVIAREEAAKSRNARS